MLLIPTTIEVPDQPLPERATPVVWVWLALVLSLFVIERLVVIDHDLGFGWFPNNVFAGVTFVIASWSLYGDPALFEVWQLWSHLLIHPQWWLLAVEIILMLVLGRALERVMGSALFAAVLACLGPLGGVTTVLLTQESVHAGALPLMLGLVGMILGRLPGAVTGWGLVWWAIVAVGYWPLFRLPTHTLMFLLLVLSLVIAPAHSAIASIVVGLLLVGTGFGLGALVRRFDTPRLA